MPSKTGLRGRAPLAAVVAGAALLAACADADPAGVEVERAGARSTTDAAKLDARAPHDGQTVYRGLFLGEGPVAAALPELFEGQSASGFATTEEERRDAAWLEAEILRRVGAQDPTFFTRFGADAQSGDHLRVQAALNEAAARTDEAFVQWAKESSAAAAQQPGAFAGVKFDSSADSIFLAGDTILVDNGQKVAAIGAGAFFAVYKFIYRVVAINRNLAVNRNAAINRNVAINVNWVYNRNRFWGSKASVVSADVGEQTLGQDYVVNLVATRVSAPVATETFQAAGLEQESLGHASAAAAAY